MILILDGNNIAFVCNTSQTLSSKKGFPTQAIYGFFESLYHYLDKFSPVDKVMIVFDGGHSIKRKKLYPAYKERDKTKDEEKIKQLHLQMPKIKEMLLCFPIDYFELHNTEADDVIAIFAQETKEQDVVIVSSDKDFYQLINEDVSIYNPVSIAKVRYLNSSNFKRVKGLRPCQWLDYRSMTGDKGDNIPGCFGVGEKTALSIMQKFGSYRAFRKAIMDGQYSPNKFERKAFDDLKSFELSKRLMDLKNTEMVDKPENISKNIKRGVLNKPRLKEIFKELDMREALNSIDSILRLMPI